MRILEAILGDIKKLEGRTDTAAVVGCEELQQELAEYMNTKTNRRPMYVEGMRMGVEFHKSFSEIDRTKSDDE